jgi:hypothetical protein
MVEQRVDKEPMRGCVLRWIDCARAASSYVFSIVAVVCRRDESEKRINRMNQSFEIRPSAARFLPPISKSTYSIIILTIYTRADNGGASCAIHWDHNGDLV